MLLVSRNKFTDQDKVALRKLCVLPEQIQELEKELLWVWVSAQASPPMADVRGEIKALLTAIKKFRDHLLRLHNARPDENPKENLPRYEAMKQIGLANTAAKQYSPDESDAHDMMEKILFSLVPLTVATRAALSGLSADQTRHRKASYHPIAALDGALRRGFRRHHEQENPGKPLPAYDLTASANPSGRYLDIMSLCFRAAGHGTEEPLRAIRAFIAWNQKRTNLGHELANRDQTGEVLLPQAKPSKRGRRPKRQAP